MDARHAADDPRHRWYFFKEAFSPSLVDRAVADSGCEKMGIVLDPFSGSGTVPLRAATLGLEAYGLEVNPFLAFVSKTKLRSLKHTAITECLPLILRGARAGAKSPLEGFSTFSKRNDATKWLFNGHVLRAFEGGWQASESVTKSTRDLLRLCLIGAAMDNCNATKDGKCLRYRSDWKEQDYGRIDFTDAFATRAEMMAEDLKNLPLRNNRAKVRRTDSRTAKLPTRFRLCVTSPPYLNSFDYTDIYRPELFLGKFVGDMGELKRLRLRTLRSHVQANWPLPTISDFGQLYADNIAKLRAHVGQLWDARIPVMVQAYFQDMQGVLTSLRRHAENNASLWMVVSTSSYGGVEIPVDLILADIGGRVGWHLREVTVLRYLTRLSVQQWDTLSSQKNNRPHLRESLIILDAQPRSG